MSETTKSRANSIKDALTNASAYLSYAADSAYNLGDKSLIEKIEKVKSSIKDTKEYIASRTGANS